jgi:hypothetical protein
VRHQGPIGGGLGGSGKARAWQAVVGMVSAFSRPARCGSPGRRATSADCALCLRYRGQRRAVPPKSAAAATRGRKRLAGGSRKFTTR